MKQRFLKAVGGMVLVCTFALTGCAGSPAPAAPADKRVVVIREASDDELTVAIGKISDYLNANLTPGNKLVFLNIASAYPAFSEYVIDALTANTVNDNVFTVVDRQQLESIRTEMGIWKSDGVDEDSAKEVGRILGADIIISGWISKRDGYRLSIRPFAVDNAPTPKDIIDSQSIQDIPESSTITALLESDVAGRGWLGVSIIGLDLDRNREVFQVLGLEGKRGALVSQIFLDSPAAKGGIQPGDFITHLNGRVVRGTNALTLTIRDFQPGEQVAVTVIRDGAEQELNVHIEARNDAIVADSKKLWPGFNADPLTERLRTDRELDEDAQGVIAAQVYNESPSSVTGLQQGDRIIAVNGEPVQDLAAFYRVLRERADQGLWFMVVRGETTGSRVRMETERYDKR
jgi:hypothetical protein